MRFPPCFKPEEWEMAHRRGWVGWQAESEWTCLQSLPKACAGFSGPGHLWSRSQTGGMLSCTSAANGTLGFV